MEGEGGFPMKFRFFSVIFCCFFVFLNVLADEKSEKSGNTDELTAFGPGDFERSDGDSPLKGGNFASALFNLLQNQDPNQKSKTFPPDSSFFDHDLKNSECPDQNLPDSICVRMTGSHAKCNCSGMEWIVKCINGAWSPSLSEICPEESEEYPKTSDNCLPLQISDASLRRVGLETETDRSTNSVQKLNLNSVGTTFEAICADPNRSFGSDFGWDEKVVLVCTSGGHWIPDPASLKCRPKAVENLKNEESKNFEYFFLYSTKFLLQKFEIIFSVSAFEKFARNSLHLQQHFRTSHSWLRSPNQLPKFGISRFSDFRFEMRTRWKMVR